MTKDEIKEMFLANAQLKHMPLVDLKRLSLEEYLDKTTRQYIKENLDGQDFSPLSSKQSNEMSIKDAFNVLAMACQSATNLEQLCKPNGISDDDIRGLVEIRKMALNRIADEFSPKTKNPEV